MNTFGAIPTSVICRFSELTKNEIIVMCYLYTRRNRKTGQCNPRQSEIARDTGIHKSHVSRAVDGLFDKGWVCKQDDNNFILTMPMIKGRPSLPFNAPRPVRVTEKELPNPQQKVTETATEKLPVSQPAETPKVAELVTEVADLVTESCEIGNSLIKERNTLRTHKEHNKDTSTSDIFTEWQKVLNHPKAKLDKKRKSRIAARLAEGFTVDELKSVPHGVLRSPHHLGVNATGTRYDGIETIYRDAAQVEKFRDLAMAQPTAIHRPGSVGKPQPVPEIWKCPTCLDTGEKDVPVPEDRRTFTGQIEYIACPDCAATPEAIAA